MRLVDSRQQVLHTLRKTSFCSSQTTTRDISKIPRMFQSFVLFVSFKTNHLCAPFHSLLLTRLEFTSAVFDSSEISVPQAHQHSCQCCCTHDAAEPQLESISRSAILEDGQDGKAWLGLILALQRSQESLDEGGIGNSSHTCIHARMPFRSALVDRMRRFLHVDDVNDGGDTKPTSEKSRGEP